MIDHTSGLCGPLAVCVRCIRDTEIGLVLWLIESYIAVVRY